MEDFKTELVLVLLLAVISVGFGATDPNDLAILNEFRKGLENPELLKWPPNDNDPCGNKWPSVFCDGSRVSQIQVQGFGLKGPLPQYFNQLSMLSNIGLQNNEFSGPLPSFSGLKNLRYAFLNYNNFTSVPADFFTGLNSLEVLALDGNNLNGSSGWMFPPALSNSAQLTNLTCMSCNLVGPLPDFLGSMSSLSVLSLSDNRLTGGIPASFKGMILTRLWLNNQVGGGMTGSIDVVTTMTSLNSLWLHGNQFSGTIPDNIGDLSLLQDLNLNGNEFVGLIPKSLGDMSLSHLDLNNNKFMGPIPKFKASKVSYSSNLFCQTQAGVACAPQVMALIEFLGAMGYPLRLVSAWTGNDPCQGPWLGLNCRSGDVSVINLPKFSLNGTLSPSLANLISLSEIRLQNNNLSGSIPSNWTGLKSLTLLDFSGNNISPPVPQFSSTVKLVTVGNPLLGGKQSPSSPTSGTGGLSPPDTRSSSTTDPGSNSGNGIGPTSNRSKASIIVSTVVPVVSVVVVAFLAIPLSIYLCKKKKRNEQAPSSLVIHPRDPSDPNNLVKIVVANNTNNSTSTATESGSASRNNSGLGGSHVIESGNLVISVQVIRNVTNNFSSENELGRGGFGVVYGGELEDGTKIAVKRMESGVITSKALDEFQSEIAVLSKVRHRHLVSLLGYSIAGNERLLIYEYMSEGALSKHLFHWKTFKLEPLSWKRRLTIALDVARGMEYLHSLAHQSFIHRDLKSSNILLDDDFRAKVSDFGLVKLAPDGERSVVTRLAGTFGYLAPEYAVTGKLTTKADVFSFGVVLMELLTGLMALDEDRSEECQHLAAWFWHIKSDKEKLMAAVDPTLGCKEDISETICRIAELAGHCTAREPTQRPDMGYAVNVLAPLVEKWKPIDDDTEEFSGIDYSLPLNQMVKGWQESEGSDFSCVDLQDSKGSIPSRPTGFADSFTSVDGR
ncbi:receptor-like kinase TMK3 [Cucurbita maxima]|uniref:non-specific serine/threonine protein kinase n=1 Tax=Cucurbita maxima TaxID=3661 RepID=A0A6J1J3Y6_CUCMA|nr:receptor-like kinase TMK3 [Cucurbita maxima]